MNKYELTVVLPAGTSAAKKKTFEELVKKLIESLDGKIAKSNDWGEQELAYRIKKSDSGVFLSYELELSPEKTKQVDTKLKTDDGVLRHLLIKAN